MGGMHSPKVWPIFVIFSFFLAILVHYSPPPMLTKDQPLLRTHQIYNDFFYWILQGEHAIKIIFIFYAQHFPTILPIVVLSLAIRKICPVLWFFFSNPDFDSSLQNFHGYSMTCSDASKWEKKSYYEKTAQFKSLLKHLSELHLQNYAAWKPEKISLS